MHTTSAYICNHYYVINLPDLLVIPFLVEKIAFHQNTLTHKDTSMDGAVQATGISSFKKQI